MAIRVRDLKDPTGTGRAGWWAAWCDVCGEYVSKFDDTPDMAMRHGEDHKMRAHGTLSLLGEEV